MLEKKRERGESFKTWSDPSLVGNVARLVSGSIFTDVLLIIMIIASYSVL